MSDVESPPVSLGITLAALGGCISKLQTALLAGRLSEFERGIAPQAELCRELRALAAANVNPQGGWVLEISRPNLTGVRAQARVLAAVLRKSRQNLSALQNALHGRALTYPAATGTAHGRN
jgi:hypothetical protein